MIVYKNDQYDQFHCVGSDCLYTCCGGDWVITVDEKTDRYYQSIDGEFGKFLNDNILRGESGLCVKRDAAGRCRFLSENGLCRIQMELGPEALCDTCRLYPRIARNPSGNLVLMSMTPSCPEVGRELLTHREPLKLLLAKKERPNEAMADDAQLSRIFEVNFRLIQNRKLDIIQRQKLFLLLNQALQEARSAGDRAKTEALLQYFSEPQIYRSLVPKEEHKCILSGKIRVLKELSELLLQRVITVETTKVYVDTLNYLFSIEGNEDSMARLYPFFERLNSGKHEREQENLLINTLFLHYMNEDFGGNLYLQAGYIVVYNQLLRIFSALGSAQFGSMAPLDTRVMYLAFTARAFEHGEALRDLFGDRLLADGLLDIPFLFQLIS